MAANEYEPSAEAVEALAKELCGAFNTADTGGQHWNRLTNNGHDGYRAEARFILRRQHARESGLLLAVAQLATLGGGHSDGNRIAQAALAAHAKLDAPKVPTLLELHAAFERHESPDTVRPLLAALVKAATERGERGA